MALRATKCDENSIWRGPILAAAGFPAGIAA